MSTFNKRRDYTNQTFGLLTAIEPTEGRYGTGVLWRMRCKCRNEVLRVPSLLSNQRNRKSPHSCGCTSLPGAKPQNPNLHRPRPGARAPTPTAGPYWVIESISGYYTGTHDARAAGAAGFSKDLKEAIRFARQLDAERLRTGLFGPAAFAFQIQCCW